MRDEGLDQLQSPYEKPPLQSSHAPQLELEKRPQGWDSEGNKETGAADSPIDKFQTSNPESSLPTAVSITGPTLSDKPNGILEEGSPPPPETRPPLEGTKYGRLGGRFTAYFVDIIVIYFIVFVFYFVSAAVKLPVTAEQGEAQLVYFCVLLVYMVVAQTAFHTTIGKYVHGLEVCSANPNRKYPAFWRILLRESFGRLLSSFFFGIGYWRVNNKERGQALSDEMAGTVVTVRPTNRVLARAFAAFVLVAFVLDVGAIGYGYYKEDRDKRYAALEQQMDAAGNAVIVARKDVDSRLNSVPTVNTWTDFAAWQEAMTSLKNDLDVYENRIDHIQELIQSALSENLAASEAERKQLVTLHQVYELRKQQAGKLRQEANLVVSCEPTQNAYAGLRNDLALLDSDINGLETKASQLLAEINAK